MDIQILLAKLQDNINKYMVNNESNLAGQVLFRGFNLRKTLEQGLAIDLWREAENKGYNALTYPLPKGELGVLPVGSFDIHECLVQNGTACKLAKIDVKLQRGFAITDTVMRDPYTSQKGEN